MGHSRPWRMFVFWCKADTLGQRQVHTAIPYLKRQETKYMHTCARVNTCPHFIITLDQDTDLHSNRLGRGSSCKEVMSSNSWVLRATSPGAGAPGVAQQQISCRRHSIVRPELQDQGHEHMPGVSVDTARIMINLAKSMLGTWWLHHPLPVLLGPGWGWQNIPQDCQARGCTEQDTRSLAALTWMQTGPPNLGNSPKGVL